MQITITVSEKEEHFLREIASEIGRLNGTEAAIDEAVHECIRMAMFEESEEEV